MGALSWTSGIGSRSLGLGQYEAAFRENAIDETVLHDLTEDHLRELGFPLGARLKLLKAIAALNASSTSRDRPLNKVTGQAATAPAPQATAAPLTEVAGERRYLTVMFCDLVGSTGISAQLDAEEWRDLVGSYLDAASAAVAEMGGHVPKNLATDFWRCSAIHSRTKTTPSARSGRLSQSNGR